MNSKKTKRRQLISLTCNDINSLTGSLNTLTTTQLESLSDNDFISCQTILGLSANSWSIAQLNSLAIIAKRVYPNLASISDKNLIALNTILYGFSNTDLSNLVFSSVNSIQALGSLNGWSTSQVKFKKN